MSKVQIDDSACMWRMSGLTLDGTAKPVSRDQILRRIRGRGKIILFVQLTTRRIGNHSWLMYILLNVMTIHTYCIYPVRDNEVDTRF